jgi:hypothetical protein
VVSSTNTCPLVALQCMTATREVPRLLLAAGEFLLCF